MAGIGYGSGFEPSKLSAIQVGVEEVAKKQSSFWTFLRILITIAEVGLSLIPGVGAVGGTVIALASAGAQTAIDVASGGKVTPVNLLINFSSALIPGAVAGIKAIRPIYLTEVATGRLGVYGLESEVVENIFQKGISRGTEDIAKLRGFEVNRAIKAASDVRGSARFLESFKTSLNPGVVSASAEAAEGTEEDLRRILARSGFSTQEFQELDALLSKVTDRGARQSITLDYLRSVGGVDRARKFAEAYGEAFKNKELLKAVGSLEKGVPTNKVVKTWRRFVRALGKPAGSDFNDMVVQPTQAIFDAGDLGRAPIEYAYKKLKKAISKQFEKFGELAEQGEKIEEAFVKAGGIVMEDRAILGYKVIEEVGQHFLLQIAFRPGLSSLGLGTGSKHATWNGKRTKNFGGKAPVYVQATIAQVKRLESEGMSYYLRKWAYSRGGRPLGIKAFGLLGLTPVAEMILPFINTGLFRNMLSLSSNIVQNVTKTITGEGGFAKGWANKFLGSFNRSWKNRGGRLFANAVVGNAASVFFGRKVGTLIGKETQRILSSATTTLNSRLATKNPTSTFGGTFIKSLIAKEMQGTVSHIKRASGGNTVTQTMNAQRKLGFVQRVPSSISGGKFALTNFKIGV